MTTTTSGGSAGIILRPFEPADAPAFVAAARESVGTVGRWMAWCRSDFSESDALRWFDSCEIAAREGSSIEFGVFSAIDGALIGGVGSNQFNRTHNFCNLGYWTRASRQRQGHASTAAKLLVQRAFEDFGVSRVELIIEVGNEASAGVARKIGAGFECVARNRVVVGERIAAAWVFSLVPPFAPTSSQPSL